MQTTMPRKEMPGKKLPKIAMVASYGNNCGMSTYTRYLVDAMRKLADVTVFAERIEGAAEEPGVVRCWDRAKGVYEGVLHEVAKIGPDTVFIQHEYGNMNNPVQWNLMVGHLSSMFRTVAVMHSVYDHKDKLAFEAPCQEIITHSLPGRDLLAKKGITHATIHYIPHGCVEPRDMELKWSAMGGKPVIFQFGFGFEYKGWGSVGDIVERLRPEFPDVAYIGVFNVSKFCAPMHNQYYANLMRGIRERGLERNVVLHRGFRSEEALFSYMKQARVNLFPYWNHPEWRVFGASGAVRLALASGTPTIVGDVPFFHEFKGYIPVCTTADEYAAEIGRLFKDPKYREAVQQRMLDFITERTWDKVAAWYLQCEADEPFTAPIPEAKA